MNGQMRRAGRSRPTVRAAVVALLFLGSARVALADAPLPFEGTWVRADRLCSPAAPSARTYMGRTLISASGRCSIRKIAFGAGEFEIFEDCRRSERPGNVVEKIRMLGPDALILKYQVNRLKIPRGRRYMRCTVAAPKPPAPAASHAPTTAPAPKPPAVTPPHDPE